tara:strand:+ start:8612 stop:9097 length:486 start_codon:yes stop_codon:yes gene_type:complete
MAKNIDSKKYPYLIKYPDIIQIINKSTYLKDINGITYKRFLFTLNKFLIVYEQLLNNNLSDKLLYDNLLVISKDILNMVNSFGTKLIIYQSPTHDLNTLTNMDNIENLLEELKILLGKYLQKIHYKINKKWHLNDINIFMSPIYPDDIPGKTENIDNYNVY